MSNRNFDNSVIIKRLQNQVYARNLYLNNTNGKTVINNPQNSNGDSSQFTLYIPGAQTEYFRGLIGEGETISVGGTFGIASTPPTAQTDIRVFSDTAAPAAPAPETQLLVNPEFIDIISNGAVGWTSTRGWQAYSETSASAPTAVINIPTRDVYPTSTSTGFVIFSFVSATISQTVSISSLDGYNTITSVLNIVNVPNRIYEVDSLADTFKFEIEYKNISGTVLYTSTTGDTRAPSNWTDYTLIFTRANATDPAKPFDEIKSITVKIIGVDSGYWNGQYGAVMDYCRLTIS